MSETTQVSKAQKFIENPFVGQDYLKLDKGKRTIIAGSTKKVLVDSETGETEGITLMHKYKEVDKTAFVKLFVDEVSSLFELSKTGLKTFGFVLQNLEINKDVIYIYIPDLMQYADWHTLKQAYKGLGELIANKIIAPSVKSNLWYVNPNVVFNGDRIAFVKEYRLKKPQEVKQLNAFSKEDE